MSGATETRLACIALLALLACKAEQQPQLNALSASEEAAGWKLLFDGETFDGWRGVGRDSIPGGPRCPPLRTDNRWRAVTS
jgi:hypothetical protein